MYRMNYSCGSTPRDRLDESLLARIAEQHGDSCQRCAPRRASRSSQRCQECENTAPVRMAENSDCDCEHYENSEFDYSLAMVYSPHQEWQNLHCLDEGFVAGTIFKELDKPFYGPKCHGGNCYE